MRSSRGDGPNTAQAVAPGAESSPRTLCRALPATTWPRRCGGSKPPAIRLSCTSMTALLARCPMASATFDDFKARFEQPAEMAADLPTPVKGGNGPRFAEKVDAPVTHLAGTDDVPAPKPKAQRKASLQTSAKPLQFDPEMVARVVAFAIEREAI